jgi:hypothetical protein
VIEKPHRFLIDRVSSYGEEGMAYLRRRKLRSLPFARIRFEGGEEVALDASDSRRGELFAVAEELIAAERED